MSAVAPDRPARFAGSWYPGDAVSLRSALAAATPDSTPSPARAIVVPHAGYVYSLAVAAETYAQVVVPELAIVLCPNHTVPPPIVSLWPGGSWETPLGRVPVDVALSERILAECPDVVAETGAHAREHAIELHLPLLQYHRPDVRLVALVVATSSFAALERLGQGIARAIGDRQDVLLVASTDMSHQVPAEVARAQDERALRHLLDLDPRGLLETCVRERITMCGVRPTTAAMVAAKALGATRAELIRYANSGDVSGDYDRVVGYAGAVIR